MERRTQILIEDDRRKLIECLLDLLGIGVMLLLGVLGVLNVFGLI